MTGFAKKNCITFTLNYMEKFSRAKISMTGFAIGYSQKEFHNIHTELHGDIMFLRILSSRLIRLQLVKLVKILGLKNF